MRMSDVMEQREKLVDHHGHIPAGPAKGVGGCCHAKVL